MSIHLVGKRRPSLDPIGFREFDGGRIEAFSGDDVVAGGAIRSDVSGPEPAIDGLFELSSVVAPQRPAGVAPGDRTKRKG